MLSQELRYITPNRCHFCQFCGIVMEKHNFGALLILFFKWEAYNSKKIFLAKKKRKKKKCGTFPRNSLGVVNLKVRPL